MNILEEVKKIEDYIIEMRRHFHKYPELSWNEFETQKKICEELDKMGIPNIKVCGTGVIGTIVGNKKKPVLGIRADIDALNIAENTNLPFSSVNEGVSHACGHDAHIAMLLGAAKILNEHREELNCTVKLIFQPAEEFIKDSGAKHMMLLDEMKELDNIVGAHIWSYLDSGKISVRKGAILSSADTFKIEVIGKSGHGAIPHQTIDPIVTSAGLINNLQTLASREISATDTFVLSICSIKAGDSANIIPDKAILEGTTRTFNPELRKGFKDMMERMIEYTCKAYRADFNFEYYYGTPPTVNEEKSSLIAEKSVVDALGEDGLTRVEPSMVGEDFAKMLGEIPGCFVLVGAKNDVEGKNYPHHNAKFDIDEKALKNGSAFFVQYILNVEKEFV